MEKSTLYLGLEYELTLLELNVDLRICDLMYWRHKARPCLTICGLTCVGVARYHPMVAESRRDTAAAAELVTIVLKRRLVRSRGDRAEVCAGLWESARLFNYKFYVNILNRMQLLN